MQNDTLRIYEQNEYSMISILNFELCDRIVIIYFQTLKGKMLQANQPKTNRMLRNTTPPNAKLHITIKR